MSARNNDLIKDLREEIFISIEFRPGFPRDSERRLTISEKINGSREYKTSRLRASES